MTEQYFPLTNAQTLPTDDEEPPSNDAPVLDAGEDGWDEYRDPDIESSTSLSEFEGDNGGLDPAGRRALVVLMKKRFITSASHPQEYRALVANQVGIGRRLNDMYLTLHLDTEREVAFKRQVPSPTPGRFPTLLHATEWKREETILLAHLRALARAEVNAGRTRAFVDRADLLEHVASLRPPDSSDQLYEADRTGGAVESLVSTGLLIGRKDADRFEIAVRALETLLDLATLKSLLAWIRSQADPAQVLAEYDQAANPGSHIHVTDPDPGDEPTPQAMTPQEQA